MNRWRRMVSLLLMAVMLLSVLPLPAMASGALSDKHFGDLFYSVNGDHVEIVGCIDDATEIVVPETIDNLPVTVIAKSAFHSHSFLTSFTAPSTLIHISKWAFRYCSQLQTVNLSQSAVTTIDQQAFQGCGKLATVQFPADLETIGEEAFLDCELLGSVNLSGTALSTLGRRAFHGCTALSEATVPDTLSTLGVGAFGLCNLTYMDLSSTAVTEIAGATFPSSLAAVSLPDGLIAIGEGAFYRTALEEIRFPDTLTAIGKDAFGYCTSLASVTWPNNPNFTTVNGFKGCTALPDTFVSLLPSSVTTIGEEAFYECAFTEAVIPANVETIGDSAFNSCENLTRLSLGSGLKSIGVYAFFGCDALTGQTVDIPSTVFSIGYGAFGAIGYSEDSDGYDKPFTLIIRNRDLSLAPETDIGIFLYDDNSGNPVQDILDFSYGANLYGYLTDSNGQPSDIYTMYLRKKDQDSAYIGTFTELTGEETHESYTVSGVLPKGATVKLYRGNDEVATTAGESADSFTATVEAGAGVLVKISLPGYNDLYLGRSIGEFTGNWDLGTVTEADMTPVPVNHKLYVTVTREGEPYRSFKKLTLTVKMGAATLTEGEDYRLQYPYLILDEAIPQEAEITLTVTPEADLMLTGGSATGTKASGAFTQIDLRSWGSGLITVTNSADVCRVLVFDGEGTLVDAGVSANNYQTAQLPAGEYRVVAFVQNELFSAVAEYAQLSTMGLSPGEYYALGSIIVTDGGVATLTLSVPELNTAALTALLQTEGTGVMVDVGQVAAGETVCARVQYALRQAPAASATVKVALPNDAVFLGAYDDEGKQLVAMTNHTVTFSTQQMSGNYYVFFSVNEVGEHGVSASVILGGVTAPAGSDVFTVERLRVDTGGRWLTGRSGAAVVYGKPVSYVTVTLPDGSSEHAYVNQSGRVALSYTLPEDAVSGDRFTITAACGDASASGEVVYYPCGTRVETLYFIHGGKKTELIRNGARVMPVPYYTYYAVGLEQYKYWTFGATLRSSQPFPEEEPVQVIITMMDGSTQNVDLTRVSETSSDKGWVYDYAGEIYLPQAGEHVFKKALIPAEFELLYVPHAPEIDFNAMLERAWQDAVARYAPLLDNGELMENQLNPEIAGALLSGAYKVSEEAWFDQLSADVQADVLAAEEALADAAEVLCDLYGISMSEVDDYLIPNPDTEDPDAPPILDGEKVLAKNGITFSASEFDADALAADGYTVYYPPTTRKSVGNGVAVKDNGNGFSTVSEQSGQKMTVDYTDHARSNAITAAKLQALDKAGTASELAGDALAKSGGSATSAKWLKGCGKAVALGGIVLGEIDAWNNVTDLGNIWGDIAALKGYRKNLSIWMERYRNLHGTDSCLLALSKEYVAVQNLEDAMQAYADDSHFNVLAGVVLNGIGVIDLGASGLVYDYASNSLAMTKAAQIEALIVAWDLARMETNRSCEEGEEIARRYWEGNTVKATAILDPSGFVYEALESNPLPDVTAAIWYDEDDDHTSGVTLWGAGDYDQVNPQTTPDDGTYAWDVPQGYWQVRFTKEGYADTATDWMEVPPPRMNLKTPMVSTAAPAVASAVAYPDYIEVLFTQYMDTAAPLTLPEGMSGTWQGGEAYSKALRVTKEGGFTKGDAVDFTLSGAQNYAGTALADYQSALTVTARPAEIVLNYASVIAMKAGETPRVTVRVKDSEGQYLPGVTVEAAVTNNLLATVAASAATDEEGKAVLDAAALLPGLTEMTFTVSGTTLTKTVALRITTDDNRPQRPTATIGNTAFTAASPKENNITVDSGTLLTIASEAGTTIYYTTDDTCPCQNSASRKVYTGPIAITRDTRFRIAAYRDGMAYSQRLNINATIIAAGEETHAHTLTRIPAKAATATSPGNREYYVCADCGKWFSDAEGREEILRRSSVIIPAKGSSHTGAPTGDNSHPALWLMLALFSLAGIVMAHSGKRRRAE